MWSAQRRSLHLPALIALKNNINIENCSFCMSSLFNFSSIFPEGQLTPFAPVCGRPWTFVCVCVCVFCGWRRVRLAGVLRRARRQQGSLQYHELPAKPRDAALRVRDRRTMGRRSEHGHRRPRQRRPHHVGRRYSCQRTRHHGHTNNVISAPSLSTFRQRLQEAQLSPRDRAMRRVN